MDEMKVEWCEIRRVEQIKYLGGNLMYNSSKASDDDKCCDFLRQFNGMYHKFKFL